MKTKQEILKSTLAVLHELESTDPNPNLKKYLQVRLETLVEVLGDDLPADYYERIDEALEL